VASTSVRPNYLGLLRLHLYIQRIHNSIVEDVFWDAKNGAAVDTGQMWMSIHTRHIMSRMWTWSSRFISRVVVGTDHWRFVEYDTAAHEIRPRDPNGALFWPGAPHPVQVVHHPGTHEQPFMRPALYQQRSLRGRP
jgi:hypothetical protein